MENRKIDAIKKILFLFLIFSLGLYSENLDTTGLKFDKKRLTSSAELDLTYFKPIILPPNSSIEFEIKIEKIDDFGYIFAIKNQQENNFVLTYFFDNKKRIGQFILSNINESKQIVKINIDENILINKSFLDVKILFDYYNQKIDLQINNFKQSGILVNKNKGHNFKLTFGEYDNVVSIIKNIKIFDLEENRLIYHWPLNQTDGSIVNEIVQNHFGKRGSSVWMKKDFNQFKLINEIEKNNDSDFTNNENIVYNEEENSIVLFSKNEIINYNLITNKYEKIKINEAWVRYLFYNPTLKKYFRMQAGLQNVTSFDFKKNKFEFEEFQESDNFRLHAIGDARWFNQKDSCMYIFGGYGWFKTYNDLYKYNFKLKEWKIVHTVGERIEPRGTQIIRKDSNTILLFGGRGNYTGEQIFVFQNFNDLWSLDLNTYTFKKIKDFADKTDTILFEHFVNRSINNDLFCIKKIKNNNYFVKIDGKNYNQSVISKLNFHPIKLIYNDSIKKIISVSFEDSKIKIHSINYPPVGTDDIENIQSYFDFIPSWVYFLIVIIVLSGGTNFILLKSYKKQNINVLPLNYEEDDFEVKPLQYKIKYFGDLAICNSDYENISSELQMRVKELFVAITILSQKNTSGVLIEEITKLMWPGKTVLETKGIRGITVKRFRDFLKKYDIGTFEIKHRRFYFYFNENKKIDLIDFHEFEKKLINSDYVLNEKFLMHYLNIVSKKFLVNLNFEWLEDYKIEINKNIIFTLHKFLHFKMNDKLKEELIENCLLIDEFDEKAIIAKIQYLAKNNKKDEARKYYEQFCKKYEKNKESIFPKKFSEII